MRACLLGLLMTLGCGRQLNPEYCLHHPTDGDCLDAGLVFIDAPAPCTSAAQCMTDPDKSVCDVGLGACVHCTPTNHAACTGDTAVCTTDDVCVGCDSNSQCATNICLTGTGTCAAPGDVLFVSVTPTGTGTCLSDTNRCTLSTALGKARLGMGHVISMASGDYHEGPLTLDIANLQIVAAAGQMVLITDNTTGSIFNVTTGPVLIQNVTIYSAQNADAINCSNNASLTLDEVTLQDNPKSGLHARNCNVTIDRGLYQRNHDHSMDIDDTNLVTRNSIFLDNGNDQIDDGTVKLGAGTTGEFRFNTVAFNTGSSGGGGGGFQQQPQPNSGLYCAIANLQFKVFNATDNLFADNTGQQIGVTNECDASRSWQGTATTVMFVKATSPYDVHLTQATPTASPNTIRDNGNANCGNVTHDYDNLARPYNQACDLGAYEFRPN